METTSAIMSVFIRFPILRERVMNHTDGETVAMKIHSHTLTVVCLIVFSIRDLLKTINPAGNGAWYFPSNNDSLP
ncbi:MAG: hypothetical protein LUQ36_01015 [Methanoregula sp.]|nr:hypothetical protein [Methanoregula sp.]